MCDRSMYNRVDSTIIEALQRIAGPENVLTGPSGYGPSGYGPSGYGPGGYGPGDSAAGGGEELERYAHDEVVGLRADPEAVVRVTSADQVAEIFRLAQKMRVPVTPRGAGYGLSGGAVPVCGGIVLSLERMNRILEIDRENLMVTVEPGVITGDLHRAVEAEGLFYPPDPASLDSCTIGGNIAEDAGGPRAVKYGVTKDYVAGLEAVLPSGEMIRCGGKLVKDVAGYNLAQLLVGSEGTLAVVTKIILRLLPLPKVRVDLLVPYDDFQAAANTVAAIIAARILPTTLEFMEQDSILAVERLLERKVPFDDAAAHLLIQLDGNQQDAVDRDYEAVGEICLEHGARDVLVAKDARTRDRLWEGRRKIIEALKHASPINHMEDVVVPRSRIPQLLAGIKQLAAAHRVRVVCFGHAGDGNVHVNVLKDDLPEAEWEPLVPALSEQIYRLTLSLGGTLTGEHGIGVTRRRYLPMALGKAEIEVMRGIKAAFDPNGILNPGKIFP